ncbi:MAG: hypothetical protein SVM86_03180, partial [Candidatus Cloacimonadota bacterium]|nr:hypothetical protein [Candidatus Cloacimonadota bacterium]
MVFKLFSILLVFLLTQLNAQTFWAQDEESYYADELQEYLMELEESPLNLNKATPEELYKLPWFSREEVKKIVQIRENKDIESWNALRKIGMDEFEIEELKKYITFEDVKKYKFSHRTRIELKENNLDKKSCAKFYQRTQVSTQDFRFGFLIQKDPQESDIFDFYSYYLEFFKNNTHAVIGKYRLNWGQGLIFASKLGFSKTAQTSYTKLYHTNFIAPYTSSYEIWDLQGVASEINLDKFKITTFVSYSPLSASIYDDKIVSFNTTGIHLDPENKNNVKEKLFGMAANYYNDGIEFGIAAFYDEFDKKFADPTLNSKYNMISASVLYDKYHFPVFAEIASAKKKVAAVGGIRFGHDNFKNLLVARYYPKNFPTWHGNPFSNQSNFDNEQGLYYGLKLLPAPKLKLN